MFNENNTSFDVDFGEVIKIGGDSGLTPEQEAEINANTEARHTHENKDVLDGITQEMLDKIGTGSSGEGGGLTPEQLADLTANSKARHTHQNKNLLDKIHAYAIGEHIQAVGYDGNYFWSTREGSIIGNISVDEEKGTVTFDVISDPIFGGGGSFTFTQAIRAVSQLENDVGYVAYDDLAPIFNDFYAAFELFNTNINELNTRIDGIEGGIDEIEAMIDESGVLDE